MNVVALPSPDREVQNGYVGDLLSWVMGRMMQDSAWVTIMTNINIVAVASLADVSCIILAEGVTLEQNVIDTAIDKNINVLSTDLSSYDACVKLAECIKR